MEGGSSPVPASRARTLTEEEADAIRGEAFAREQQIKKAMVEGNQAWWDLAAGLTDLHEKGLWRWLGYDTLDAFLAQPDLGVSRSQFFRMTKLYRDLVIMREIPQKKLESLEPSKVREVAPAITSGEVEVSKALSDAESLAYRDLRAEYRPDRKTGKRPAADPTLDAEEEPEIVVCPRCGSRVPEDRVIEHAGE